MNRRVLLAVALVAAGGLIALGSAYALRPALAGLLGGLAMVGLGLLGVNTAGPAPPRRDPMTLRRSDR